jgi:hypothetical protein
MPARADPTRYCRCLVAPPSMRPETIGDVVEVSKDLGVAVRLAFIDPIVGKADNLRKSPWCQEVSNLDLGD